MILIVDASVAVKWFVAEPESAAAEAVLAGSDELSAPEILEADVLNALCKRVKRGQIPADQARKALAELRDAIPETIGTRSLLEPALELALTHEHPVHDCIYLALTLRTPGSALVTADRRLAEVAHKAGARVHRL